MTRKETGGNGKALFPTPPPFPNRGGQFSLPRWIIRGLTRDGDIMDVAFRKARLGDLDEASSLLQILNGAGAGVAHRGLTAAARLMDYGLRRVGSSCGWGRVFREGRIPGVAVP